MKTKDFRSTKAITLIALIILIVVLLILAGVTIVTLTGDNGILSQAQNANTTTQISEIEEQANLIYTAELIDRLSGQTSTELDLAVVCTELQDTTKYNYDIQLKTTDEPTVTEILVNPTTISIAQGDNTKSIEATPVVTEGTGSWYAFVDGKYYRIYIPEGKKQVKIDRTSTDVEGEGATQQVTFTSNNNKVVFNATGATTATVDCNAEGKSTVVIAVGGDATGPATITASAGDKTAECTVTVLKNVKVTTQSDDTNIGTATTITNESYVEGSTIELTAEVIDNEYEFSGWYETKDSGTETQKSTNTSYTYKIPSDATTVLLKAKFKEKPKILGTTENDSGVGYYIKKGNEYAIVFADRVAQAGTSSSFPTLSDDEKTTLFKTYRINGTYTDSNFGAKNVLTVENSTGEDRFMALALSDLGGKGALYTWYDAAGKSPGMTDINNGGGEDKLGSPTSRGFLKGKTNTETMIAKWKAKAYGNQNNNSDYKDVWGQVQSQYTKRMVCTI